MASVIAIVTNGTVVAATVAATLVAPGWLALALAGSSRRGVERLALAVGLSLAIWPLALLWTTLAGWSWSATSAQVTLLVLTGLAATSALHAASIAARRRRPDVASWSMLAVLTIAALSRAWHARDLVVPPWVDGYHHTLITRLITTAGAVPSGFEPYLAVERFYYHFGFHAVAAEVAWTAGVSEARAVLWVGQALNVLAVPAAYLLARVLGARRLSAVLAAAVPAALYWFPAYYLSWGRYTQLAGLVMLPAACVLLHDALRSPGGQARQTDDEEDVSASLSRPSGPRSRLRAWWRDWRPVLAAGTCAAGLFLTHYRVAVAYALGALVLLAGMSVVRRLPWRAAVDAVVVAVVALLLAGPWLVRVGSTGVATLAAASPTWYAGPPEVDQVPAWLFTIGANGVLLRLAGLGLVVAMLRGRQSAWLVAVFLGLLAFALNPSLTGLPPSWIVPRFAVAIAAWLPVAVGLAFLADAVAASYVPAPAGRGPVSRRTATAATLVAAAVVHAWFLRHQPPTATAVWDALILGTLAVALGWLATAWRPVRLNLPPRWRAAAAGGIVAWALVGAWASREVLNRSLELARAADLMAAAWVRANTPIEARFLVQTGHWQLGTYRGLDGGYWLPLLAGRATSMPAVFYNYGRREYGLAVASLAREVARGDALTDQELARVMERAEASYLYLGSAADDREDTFSAARLDAVPWLRRVYDADGVVIYARVRNAPSERTP